VETSNDEPVSSFLKTVLPSSDTSSDLCGIPGLGLDATDAMPDTSQCNDYRPIIGQISTPLMGRMINVPTTPIGNLNHIQISHSTPLQNRNLNGDSHTPSPYSSENSQNNAAVPVNSFDGSTSSVNPLQPPPMPPIEFLDDNNCYNKLPPKFPTWTFANETPKEPTKWEDKGVHKFTILIIST
jgi:hypothetical protein